MIAIDSRNQGRSTMTKSKVALDYLTVAFPPAASGYGLDDASITDTTSRT